MDAMPWPLAAEHLVGRQDDLVRMQYMLRPDRTAAHPPTLVLSGPGGVGKTELAAAFSGLHEKELTPVWIDFGRGEELGWWPAARALGIEVNTVEARQVDEAGIPIWVRRVHDRVRSGPYLIVVRGSDHREEGRLGDWLPDGPSSCALLLLRQRWSWTLQNQRDALAFDVAPLSLQAARDLLALRAPHLSRQISAGAADGLIYQLGGYPLALALIAEVLKGRDPGAVQEALHELRTGVTIPEDAAAGVWLAIGLALQRLPDIHMDALAALSLQVGPSWRLAQVLAGAEVLSSLARQSLLSAQDPLVRLHDLVGTYARWKTQAILARHQGIELGYAQQVLASMTAAIRDGDAEEQARLYGDLSWAMKSLFTLSDDEAAQTCLVELADLLAAYQGGIRKESLRWARLGYGEAMGRGGRKDLRDRMDQVEAEQRALTGRTG